MSDDHIKKELKKNNKHSYIMAAIACLVLTLIPFYMVFSGSASTTAIVTTITITGLIQIFVQVFYFFHLGYEPNKQWNLIALVFFMLIVVIVIAGSMWIMHELNYYMSSSAI